MVEASELNALHDYSGKDKIISSFELRDKIKAIPPLIPIKTGLAKLDRITSGFYEGQVVVMSGPTKCGKTSFCQTLTTYFSKAGVGCVWFSYEIGMRKFLEKFPNGDVPLFYIPESLTDSSLEWIEKRIVEAKCKYDAQIAFIDHLHFLVPMGATQNMSLVIGATMRELKKMAVRHSMIIFILAHVSKIPEGATPGLEHIRDSSFIAQESDMVLMITRPPFKEDDPDAQFDRSAKLRILANRETGERGVIEMTYMDNFYREVGA